MVLDNIISYMFGVWLYTFRQKLRRLEVALIEYRESLEEVSVKSVEEIEKKVALYRKRLESEYGLLDSNEDLHRSSKYFFHLPVFFLSAIDSLKILCYFNPTALILQCLSPDSLLGFFSLFDAYSI